MIVPERRLILLTAIVLLSGSGSALIFPLLTPFLWYGASLFFFVAGIDAAMGNYRFRVLGISSPAVHRMTAGQPGSIVFRVNKKIGFKFNLRVIPVLAESISIDRPAYYVFMEKKQTDMNFQIDCRAIKRGKYKMSFCYLEFSTFLRLWAIRRKFALDSEIRVYPDLVSVGKQIPGLFNRQDPGWRNQRRMGKGREFEQLREYFPGDSYEDIDWKATARRRYPVTREYEVEQSQEIYVILDASRLSTRYCRDSNHLQPGESGNGTDRITIFERYIIAALALARAADRAADRYGLLIFNSRPELFIRAERGKTHYNSCLEALYNLMPQSVAPDFEDLFSFIGTFIRKRSLLLFLTNLDDPLLSESFIKTLVNFSGKHLFMIGMLRPAGAHPLFTSASLPVDEKAVYEKLVGHMLWSSLGTTQRKLRQLGAGFTLLDEHRLCAQLVDQYREVKQRQIL